MFAATTAFVSTITLIAIAGIVRGGAALMPQRLAVFAKVSPQRAPGRKRR